MMKKNKNSVRNKEMIMMIYADNAATTPLCQAALDTMNRLLKECYGNPSSLYGLGQSAKEELEKAREEIAALVGAKPREIYFTSGGSEADNQAILSAAVLGKRKEKRHIISTAFEHHAVLHILKKLEKEGFEVTLLDVHEDGLVRPAEVAAAIREDTCLVSIMYANNETGMIQPVEEVAITKSAPSSPSGRSVPFAGKRASCSTRMRCRQWGISP